MNRVLFTRLTLTLTHALTLTLALTRTQTIGNVPDHRLTHIPSASAKCGGSAERQREREQDRERMGERERARAGTYHAAYISIN